MPTSMDIHLFIRSKNASEQYPGLVARHPRAPSLFELNEPVVLAVVGLA